MSKLAIDMRSLYLAAGLCVLALINGCTKEWYLSIERSVDGAPEFCFSRNKDCQGDGVQFNALQVARVDDTGNPVEVMWSLQGRSNTPAEYVLKRVVYGKVPVGWNQVREPSPLHDNVYYTVSGEFYFLKTVDGQYLVYSREQFFDRVVNAKK
jgi:hypothetical protein